MIDTKRIKVIAFDVFGTLVDMSAIPREEITAYVAHVTSPKWKPLELSEAWERQDAWPDSFAGVASLRKRFIVCTFSNGPIATQARILKRCGIVVDAIVPVEIWRQYKPAMRAYHNFCKAMRVDPVNVLMVTANKNFGDLEGATAVGMQSILIRSEKSPRTVIELAELLR